MVGNQVTGAASYGGGIYNAGTFKAIDTSISNNVATSGGGGLYNTGIAAFSNSLVGANLANIGGGIYHTGGGTLDSTNVTISGNTSDGNGGGIYTESLVWAANITVTDNESTGFSGGGVRNSSGTFNVHNSIIAGNRASTANVDFYGTAASGGYNIVGDTTGSAGFGGADQLNVDPLMDALAENGGSTMTHALLAGSTAINTGTNMNAPATDQRGFWRSDGLADIGAYESGVNEAPTFVGPGDGSVITPVGSSTDYGYSVAVQPDGKSVVGGYSWNGSSYDFVVTRYNLDGSLDSTFGSGDGIATIAVGTGNDLGYSVTLQPDGKILLAGASHNGVDNDFALTRLNNDGTLDVTFGGGDGIVTTDIAVNNDYARAMALQADGKIVLAGFANTGANNNFALVRYNSDGSVDTSFDGDGIVTTAVPIFSSHIDAIALQADGKIVVLGDAQDGSGSDFAVVRYNTNGSLDTSFGGTGIVITAIGTGSGSDSPQSLVVQADGKILAGGTAYNGTDFDFAVARYNSNGTLDTSFGGGDGISTIPIGSGNDSAYGMAVLPDGKIILSGKSNNGSDDDFAVARLNSDGSLDTSFGGGDGFVTAPVGAPTTSRTEWRSHRTGPSYWPDPFTMAAIWILRCNATRPMASSIHRLTP